MKFFKDKSKPKPALPSNELRHIILKLMKADSEITNPIDVLSLEDIVKGIQIFGGIGSGKTSGSARQLALEFLQRGYGGIVNCAKVGELDRWLEYGRLTNRLDDMVIFKPGGDYTFNPLKYELERDRAEGGGHVENIVSLFLSNVKMGNRLNGGGGGIGGREPFWIYAMERMLRAAIGLQRLAKLGIELTGEDTSNVFDLTITNIAKVLRDYPVGDGHYRKFFNISPPSNFEQHTALQEWADRSYTIFCLCWAMHYLNHLKQKRDEELLKGAKADVKVVMKFESEQRSFEAISSYFLNELPNLAEKTRSGILEYFFAFASPFRSGLLADYFATSTSPELLPERTFDGKIILLNWPIKQYLQLGVFAQSIYKTTWQQAVERRKANQASRPCFWFADEAHYFVSDDDIRFQATARESKAITVLITQNISNYYALMPGSNSKALVDSLLGNIATKIFHNNHDAATNEAAAETIAKDYRPSPTFGDTGNSIGQEYQYQVLPKHFTLLKTGGDGKNEGIVEAVLTTAGKEWSTGENFLKVKFKQDLK